MGELKGYACSGVRPSYVRTSSSTISNIFFSDTVCPIIPKFYVEPPRVGGDEILFAASRSHDQDGRHAHIW